jgi:hypothetical protein
MRSARTRLGVYALVLAAAFGGAYALGNVTGGDADAGTDGGHDHGVDSGAGGTIDQTDHGDHGSGDHGSGDHGEGSTGTGADLATSGLSSSVDGYRIVLVDQQPDRVAFRIDDPAGRPVTAVDEVHGADLHLLAVQRDLSDFQHVHPTVGSDGVWRVDVDLAAPGAWRLVAEVQPSATGTPIALGIDVLVPGATEVEPLPKAVPIGETSMLHLGDGQPDLGDGQPAQGAMVHRTGLEFEVTPTDGLEPYLGQSAHLVAIRAGDLAVTHLHPLDDDLGTYRFADTLPGPGTYRLYLQIQRDGTVLTFPFTIAVP